jgi:hypothetical protein
VDQPEAQVRAEQRAARDVAEDERLAETAGDEGEQGGRDDADADRGEDVGMSQAGGDHTPARRRRSRRP